MKPLSMSRRSLALLVLVALVSAFILWQTAYWTKQLATEEIRTRAGQTLDLVAGNLSSELSRFSSLPELITTNPLLVSLLEQESDKAQVQTVNLELMRINQVTGALDTYLMNEQGFTVAASNWNKPLSFVGRQFDFRPYFKMGMQGQRGRYFALGTTSGERGYFYSFPVNATTSKKILGVVVVKISLEHLEKNWGSEDHDVIVVDDDGVVFLSNNAEWHYKLLAPLGPEQMEKLVQSRRYDNKPLTYLPVVARQHNEAEQLSTIQISNAKAVGNSSAQRYLVEHKLLPDENWRVMLLAKDNDIARRVNLALVVASLVLASLLLIGFTALQRRRRLAEQLAMKDAARRELEQRVTERTEELRAAQTDLVQATKLAALGHMSAGVSHELNQPLAAIRTYADNASTYLERGQTDTASENLQAITELADRIDRIIKNLRTYARNESISSRPVAIAQVLQSALAILQDRINNESIVVKLIGLELPLKVMAGEVRLEQVFINIIGNALDSMKNSERKSLTILVSQAGDRVSTEIIDSGEGIPEAMIGHVFDPFYSTKPVGEGMGLGLSLTYGIVDQFGGELLIKNNVTGGASFTVILNEETT